MIIRTPRHKACIDDMTGAWLHHLDKLVSNGTNISPRGVPTKELSHQMFVVNMRRPVLTLPERKLNYRFMAAEANWILTGDDKVSTIAPYNKHIAKFSDDGETFFGAYGPRIKEQLPYVIDKLASDYDTRQAVLTTWRQSPPKTKDTPCTVAFAFQIRDHLLNVHAFMRSSDVWLGLPYDAFNFSMLGHLVCARLNAKDGADYVQPGDLMITMVSSHLYIENLESANRCLLEKMPWQTRTPKGMHLSEGELFWALECLMLNPNDEMMRWWA